MPNGVADGRVGPPDVGRGAQKGRDVAFEVGHFLLQHFRVGKAILKDVQHRGDRRLWFVPHDAAGLIALFGSNDAFVSKLKTFFEQGKETFNFYLPGSYYFHGNEPDMLASALFLPAGRPDLADQWTKWIGDANYTVNADGLVGNDDAGTLSSWYVLAALGLLPQPCAPGYAIVTPRFAKAELHLQNKSGPTLVTIEPPTAELPAGPTPTWHEKPLPARWLDHSELVKGGTLRYP